MIIVILLIVILGAILYLSTKKNKTETTQNQCTSNINEATFNPNYRIGVDERGREMVESCGRM